MYGWRGRIGLLVPSTNTSMEVDFFRLAPDGVSVHTARLKTEKELTMDVLANMEAAAEEAAESVATAEVNVVVFGCTAGSFQKGPEWNRKFTKKLEGIAKVPVVTTSHAAIEALKEMGLKKISVATPYPNAVNELLKSYLKSCNFDVLDLKTFDMSDQFAHTKVEPSEIYSLAKRSDTPESEGIFISCTQMRTLSIIETLEDDLKKPVITATQASMWLALRFLKVSMGKKGFGRLMERL